MRFIDRREAFDRRDLFADGVFYRQHARPHRCAVEVNGTRAACGYTAAELRARQSNDVADGPQERHLVGNVEVVIRAINRQLYHAPNFREAGACYPPSRLMLKENFSVIFSPA